MLFNRIRGNASQNTQTQQQQGQGQNSANMVVNQAGQTVQEEVSSKSGKAHVALGAAGLFAAGLAIAGIAIPTYVANRSKKSAEARITKPIAASVGAWIMDGTSPLQRQMPAIGSKPSDKSAYGFDFD